MDRIEITVPVQMTASVSFEIDREDWEAMTADERNVYITGEVNGIQRTMDREGGLGNSTAQFYGVIEDCNPAQATIYDPKEG